VRAVVWLAAGILLVGAPAGQGSARAPEEGAKAITTGRGDPALGLRAGLGSRGGGLLSGLLDSDRLRVGHQISFGVATGGGESLTVGRYLTRIDFTLRPNLLLEMDLGFETRSGSPWSGEGGEFVLPGFALTYRPSEDLRLRLEFGRTDSSRLFDLLTDTDQRF
jgi:hypothetical protein